jgi:hypothetical protein
MPKAANKIIYGGRVLIDLTSDTVDASHLLYGYTAHGADGSLITGSCTYDADTSDADAVVAEVLSGKTFYKNGSKLTGTMPNRGAQTGTISTKNGSVTILNGYHDGSGTVSIDPTEVAKIIAENIRENVTILGVTGTMSGSEDMKPQPTVNVTPYTTAQTIQPTSPTYNCLTEVVVAAIAYTEVENAAGGLTVTIGTVDPNA